MYYFWYRETLNTTAFLEDDGGLQWWLVVCHISAWALLFLCISRGIETSGKVRLASPHSQTPSPIQ